MKLAKRATEMIENNSDQLSSISNARSLDEIADYWDDHSLADHWELTVEVEFKVRATPHRRSQDSNQPRPQDSCKTD